MTDLENMTNNLFEIELLEILAGIKIDDRQTGFRLSGWWPTIKAEDRNSTNLSDGFTFSDLPTAEYYAALNGITISSITKFEGVKSLEIAYSEQGLKDKMNGTNLCNKYWKHFLCPSKV